MRFLAALGVFAYHLLPLYAVNSQLLGKLVGPGITGVSFFFVLSGFVLTWSHKPNDTAVGFYRRRFARIYPVYVVTFLLGVWVSSLYGQAFIDPAPQLPVLLLIQAWLPDPQHFWAVNTVAWSLSCEAFFYAAFPFLIRPLARSTNMTLIGTGASLIAVVVLIASVLGTAIDDPELRFWATTVFPMSRLPEFLLGVIAATLVARGWRPPMGFGAAALLTLAVLVVSTQLPHSVSPVAITVLPFVLLLSSAAVREVDTKSSPLATTFMQRLGERSYAFYLVHYLVIRTVVHYLDPAPTLGEATVMGFGCLALAVGLSALLFRFVERPLSRRLRGDATIAVSEGGSGHATA